MQLRHLVDGLAFWEDEQEVSPLSFGRGFALTSPNATFAHSAEAAGAADSIDTTITLVDHQGRALKTTAGLASATSSTGGLLALIWTTGIGAGVGLHGTAPDDIVAVSGCNILHELVANHLALIRITTNAPVFRVTKAGTYAYRLMLYIFGSRLATSGNATLAA